MSSKQTLADLKTQIDEIGSSGNFINKYRLIKNVKAFPCTEQETKLLNRHIVKTYFIFCLQLTYIIGVICFLLPNLRDMLYTFMDTDLKQYIFCGIIMALEILFIYLTTISSPVIQVIGFIGMDTFSGLICTLVIGSLFEVMDVKQALLWIFISFMETTAVFMGASLYGLLTKRDLTTWEGPLAGALLGLIITGWIFPVGSTHLTLFIYTIIDLIVFTLYTAYDNQLIKVRFLDKYRDEIADTKISWWLLALDSSEELVLDFVNMFLDFLTLFSSRDED